MGQNYIIGLNVDIFTAFKIFVLDDHKATPVSSVGHTSAVGLIDCTERSVRGQMAF